MSTEVYESDHLLLEEWTGRIYMSDGYSEPPTWPDAKTAAADLRAAADALDPPRSQTLALILQALDEPASEEELSDFGVQCAAELDQVYMARINRIIQENP